MEQAIKEIVDRHSTNILIDMVSDERNPFDGDVMPLESLALEEKIIIIRSLETSYMITEQMGNRRKKLRIGRLINKIKYGNI